MPSDELILIVDPDGQVSGLYTDALELAALGELEVTRASHVEFDGAAQEWVISLLDGEVVGSRKRRVDALALERELLQARMLEGL